MYKYEMKLCDLHSGHITQYHLLDTFFEKNYKPVGGLNNRFIFPHESTPDNNTNFGIILKIHIYNNAIFCDCAFSQPLAPALTLNGEITWLYLICAKCHAIISNESAWKIHHNRCTCRLMLYGDFYINNIFLTTCATAHKNKTILSTTYRIRRVFIKLFSKCKTIWEALKH